MQRTLLRECADKVGETVFVQGWLHNNRELGKLSFVLLRDRSALAQVVVDNASELEKLKGLQVGSVLRMEAQVGATDKTALGFELLNPQITVVNAVTAAWPVEINKPDLQTNLDTTLEYRAITLRHPKQAAIFKIQATMAAAYRQFLGGNGFTEYFGPAILASASEGGAELFRVDYFGKPAILAQSNQLYKQMMVGVYERVFALSKCFRAENSNTRRHLTEAIQYEFEMGFIDGIADVMDMEEQVVRFMLGEVATKATAELATLGANLAQLPEKPFPRLSFAEATAIISAKTGEDTTGWDDLTTESEKVLCAWARETHGSDFVFVMHYPKGKFYAFKDEQGTFHNFDLLCREAEISSGGRRIDNYDSLMAAIKAEGLNPEHFSEYLSIFKYGMPAHGGFGIGLERFTMFALGLENIREATLFPSDPKRIASQSIPESKTFGPKAIKAAIKQLFVDADVDFQVLTHEPTPTSADAARVRGLAASTGVKALILADKQSGKNLQVNLPADAKLDVKAVEAEYEKLHGKKVKFAFEKPELILEKYGLQVGGVPPFGSIFGIETWWDEAIFAQPVAAFNNAEQTSSLIATGGDLRKLVTGRQGQFSLAASV